MESDLRRWMRLVEDGGPTDEESHQIAFDDKCDQIRSQGREAFEQGEAKTASPYKTHPEPHFHNAWVGGWAEAKLESMFGPMRPS
jgi:ribosome modulation factor